MLLTKLLPIAIVAITIAQAPSLLAWCFIAVPLIYLSGASVRASLTRVEYSRGLARSRRALANRTA